VSSIYDGVTSCELDEEAARIAISMTEKLEYQQLGSRIIISNMHKSTMECFSEVMETLYNNTDVHGKHSPILADEVIEIIRKNKNELNFAIDYKRDYQFDYFGYKTLERSYLLKIFDKEKNKMQIVERPQHMYMRVAVGIHKDDIESVLKTYNLISQHYYTHASPTLFNAGTRLNQYSSCFLRGSSDCLEGIFKTVTDCAKISKLAGGIGLHVSNIRAKGSIIRGTNGKGDGLVPMLKVYNEVAKYINQSGKRKGSFAIYLEPWHADILEFLDLRKNQGHDDIRARDLFYAMWMPNLFMKQVECDGDWYLMCPDECPNLNETYGEEFENLYWKYVEEKKYRKQIKAQDVWKKIMDAQIETGVPYIAYKDAVNKKCNQKNLGTIKSSNLCCEISIY
jgi:ribonucleoside-diphosphate reductase alpha chain